MSIHYRTPAVLLGTQANLPLNHTVTGVAVTGAAVYTATVMRSTGSMTQASVQLVVTGTPSGTVSVQQSNDPLVQDTAAAATAAWSEVQSIPVTAGVIGSSATPASAIVSIQNGAAYTRVVYTNTSGTGALAVFGYGI